MIGEWKNIAEPSPAEPTSSQVIQGPVYPPQQQLLLYSSTQWEDFVHEWAHYCLKSRYASVQRFSGSGDQGIDIAGFTDSKRLMGVWDNFQCKHYDRALAPSDIWVEIGKIIWYSYKGQYVAPRRYFFVSPRGAGTKLSKLLGNSVRLREELIANWDKSVKSALTGAFEVPLDPALLEHIKGFDFGIFDAITPLQLVEEHRSSPAHAARFGGGLGSRPAPQKPPAEVAPVENRYVTQLLKAYGEHTGVAVSDVLSLPSPKLRNHFHRQREAFYQAESLRVFARDTVPTGTFEALQGDIFDGVIDTHDASHGDGYEKVCAVTKAAREVQITANALIGVTKPKDRDGICHQLVNDERLQWTQT